MKTDQIVMCVVALLLGMLLANMLKSVCGCKVVEGQSSGFKLYDELPPISPDDRKAVAEGGTAAARGDTVLEQLCPDLPPAPIPNHFKENLQNLEKYCIKQETAGRDGSAHATSMCKADKGSHKYITQMCASERARATSRLAMLTGG
jgi:hypothetical protein